MCQRTHKKRDEEVESGEWKGVRFAMRMTKLEFRRGVKEVGS
jgi:hypothetical protein